MNLAQKFFLYLSKNKIIPNIPNFQSCGSGMFIPDPDFYPSRISDPGSRIPDFGSRIPELGSRIQKQQQKRDERKFVVLPFFCSHKFHKLDYYFISEMLKNKNWTNFQRITYRTVPSKRVISSLTYNFVIILKNF